MGSVALYAVPHEKSDIAALQGDIKRRGNNLARSRMQADPAFARKVMQLLAE